LENNDIAIHATILKSHNNKKIYHIDSIKGQSYKELSNDQNNIPFLYYEPIIKGLILINRKTPLCPMELTTGLEYSKSQFDNAIDHIKEAIKNLNQTLILKIY